MSPREQLALAIAGAASVSKELEEIEQARDRAAEMVAQATADNSALSAKTDAALVDHYESVVAEPTRSAALPAAMSRALSKKPEAKAHLAALERVLSRLEASGDAKRASLTAAQDKCSEAAWRVATEEGDKRLNAFLKVRDQYHQALDLFAGLAMVPKGDYRGVGYLSPEGHAAMAPRPEFAPLAENNPPTLAYKAWLEFHNRLVLDADAQFTQGASLNAEKP